MNSINIFGRLGNDVTEHTTQGGTKFWVLNIATDRNVKKGDNWEKEAVWHDATMWGSREKLAPYLKKGTQVAISGELLYNEYEKDGVKIKRPYIAVRNIEVSWQPKPQQQQQQSAQTDFTPDDTDDLPF